ncbi:MAG: hypothetical protein DCC71_18340 [Proteobacteria bacterium]|nr:MAG: hypothetical protein DCC71_18340 [Pseudomonadota bacterium]
MKTRTALRFAAIALAGALALGCGDEASRSKLPGTQTPTDPADARPDHPTDSNPPREAPSPTSPVPATQPQAVPGQSPPGRQPSDAGVPPANSQVSPDAARGAALYATNCASCHGPGGDGDGPASAALEPKPAKHSDGAYMNALSNEHLFKVIKEGGPAVGKSPLMAPWGGTLTDAQIWDLVAFTRSLAKPPYGGTVP